MKNNNSSRKRHKGNPADRYMEGIISISGKGIGRVRIKNSDDLVEIEHHFLHTACHGDTVKILLHPKAKDKAQTGQVTEILRRSKQGFAGILEIENGIYFLVPSDLKMYADIVIPKDKLNGAKIGQKIFVTITQWTDHKKAPIGEVTKILGEPMEHNAEMEAIALEKGFDAIFPPNVVTESKQIAKNGLKSSDTDKRRDMRGTTTFTIDPFDAKDFDDALSFKDLGQNIYEVGIHIADVSHYVRPDTALDDEARRRGTSVYLVDRTIPMLPEELSNDLCSLKPNVDRLTFSAIFNIDKNGIIQKQWFGRTIIHSNKRFTYEDAQSVLDKKNGEYYKELNILNQIAKKLLKKRYADGAISLDSDEVKFKLNDQGVPISVYVKKRGDTHKLIEEFMLLANRKVAELMSTTKKNKHPLVLYRVHDLPNKEKMQDLAFFLKRLGYRVTMKDGIIPSEEINQLVLKLETNPLRDTVHTAIIRTMAKAIYTTKNIGHYGLAFKYYTHFTSPIRRYPDIIVHRLLNEFLEDHVVPKERFHTYEAMSLEASNREKEAAEAERASIKYKQVEYMASRIGNKFDGVITGMSEWGLYVEEKTTKCEGMIRMRELGDDYYTFDKRKMTIKGKKSGKKYTLGDNVRIEVKNADMNKKIIDYVFV